LSLSPFNHVPVAPFYHLPVQPAEEKALGELRAAFQYLTGPTRELEKDI